MSSVSDLIHSSFRLIGAIASGEILETNELNDGFISLNQFIQGWNTDGTMLVSRQSQRIALNSSIGSYSLSDYPIKIESASVSAGSGYLDNPLQIVDSTGWEAVPEKQAQSVFTKVLYCDYAWPTSTVCIAPLPRIGGTLEVWMYTPLSQFATVNDTINLAPGYEIALRYNFAVALLPEYPRTQSDPSLPAQAQMYKAQMAQLNAGNHMRSQAGSEVQASTANAAEALASR